MRPADHTVPCPNCGRQPALNQVGFHYGRSYGESSCYLFKYECRRFFGLYLCHAPKKPRWVSKGGAVHDWENWAKAEWNASVKEVKNE